MDLNQNYLKLWKKLETRKSKRTKWQDTEKKILNNRSSKKTTHTHERAHTHP